MSTTMKTFYVEGGLAKLLIPSLGDLTITVPSPERAVEREAARLDPHPSGQAWCAWWIERNGDTPVKISSPEGKVAVESLVAFRAGWDEAKQFIISEAGLKVVTS